MLSVFCLVSAQAGTVKTASGETISGNIIFDDALTVQLDTGGKRTLEMAEVIEARFINTNADFQVPTGIVLKGGTRLAGAFSQLQDSVVTVARTNITVPATEVAWAVYHPFYDRYTANVPSGKTGAILPGGDFFEGAVRGASDEGAKVLSPVFGLRTFDAGKRDLLAVVLAPIVPVAAPYEIRLRDGSLWQAKGIIPGIRSVTLVGGYFDKRVVPADTIAQIKAGPGRFQPITAAPPTRVEVAGGVAPAQAWSQDKTLAGIPLTAGGEIFAKGFELISGATLSWAVPPGATGISARVCVPGTTSSKIRLIFAVYADGKAVLRTNAMSSADAPAALRAPLAGARTVSLRVEPQTAIDSGSGFWLEPIFLR